MLKRYADFIIEKSNYQFGCVLVRYDLPDWQNFLLDTLGILEEDIYYIPGENYGLEDSPHMTLLYGLHTEVTDQEVQSCFTDTSLDDFKVQIDGVQLFENTNYDVVKLTVVNTPILQKVHEKLSKLPNSDKYPNYNPHITCAYVKKGTGQKYIKDYKNQFEQILNIAFTKPNGPEYLIKL